MGKFAYALTFGLAVGAYVMSHATGISGLLLRRRPAINYGKLS